MEPHNLDADLPGIMGLMRSHIEIRNRSWMKKIHRDCFIGSDAVDFLVTQGLVDTRDDAVNICNRMIAKKMLRNVNDSKTFRDSYTYYIFAEDDAEDAVLGKCNAGNGDSIHYGKGGCKWSFAPHTAHNSYVLDIALAEEVERAVAGASIEARVLAISKLRQRVREQASSEAPDWILDQSTEVNKTLVNVYSRKRPRGDFKNAKLTAMIGNSPKEVIKGILGFEKRKQMERMFEDGVVVEAIDIGETNHPLFQDVAAAEQGGHNLDPDDLLSGIPEPVPPPMRIPNLPLLQQQNSSKSEKQFARKTDDVNTFLQTVDLAGIPGDMPIAFLNDPERQHALGHLRKQMLASSPEECMLCNSRFFSPSEYRFCPCCATIACVSCVSKRVFEVVSRQIVTVCVHCYRESSRIRHPPESVKDNTNLNASLKGKWWRLEDLGIGGEDIQPNQEEKADMKVETVETVDTPDMLDDLEYMKEIGGKLEELGLAPGQNKSIRSHVVSEAGVDIDPAAMFDNEDDDDEAVEVSATDIEVNIQNEGKKKTDDQDESNNKHEDDDKTKPEDELPKKARCKRCGELILRDVESIEKHMDDCPALKRDRGVVDASTDGLRSLANIPRRPDLEKNGTRIIYHTARTTSKLFRPREVCAFQDSFIDKDGTCYVYEISVRHCDVRGMVGYASADVLLLLHAASPVKGNKDLCNLAIISQIDSRSQAPKWLLSLTEESGGIIAAPRKNDLIRELKNSGNLKNILASTETEEEEKVSLDDFELLAVLGRGGFGKVMQVKHKASNTVYAMKILKKSELQRRRQVERTKTERTILAAVQHPFIVRLYYAFQNNQKLYMVMDFVQGGDFFTLMRKYRRLPEEWVAVYVCEVAMALQHLHDMDIVYRDLKPENILLCGDGHLKLTDFGLSRFFETRPPAAEDMVGGEDAVTRSFCGTEQYMSPEMLLQQGHNWRMDWWCLGLLMHEMLSARHPFHGPSHYDTLRNMVTKQPVIDGRVSGLAGSVIRGLLIKNPRARLCCRSGIDELKSMPFFARTDWDGLYNKTVAAPHVPAIADVTDTSFFETTFTREAPIDSVSENPKAKRGGKKENGILAMFGFNVGASKKKDDLGDSPFAGFSYAKEDALATKSPEK